MKKEHKSALKNIYILLSYPVLLILFRIDYLTVEGVNLDSEVQLFHVGLIFLISPLSLPIALSMRWFHDIGLYMVG